MHADMARVNLSIDRVVFDEFANQVNKRNMTLYAFANECLSAMSKIAEEGGDPAELYNVWKVLSILKEAEVVTLPSGFLESLILELYQINKAVLLKHFRELGEQMVGLLTVFADDVPTLAKLARDFTFVVPIKHFSVLNGTSNHDGNLRIDVVGAGKSIESTECSSEFLKAVIEGYGYSVVKEELHPGTIRLYCQARNHANREVLAAAQSW
jgi:hypothetical protein